MTKLSKILKQYYQKVGNKTIFQGKFSLNQLALELWQRLGYRGIDSSSLSRIINGKRLFTVEQLGTFCMILSLMKRQKDELFLALEEDYLLRYGLKLYPSSSSLHDVIDLLTSQISKLNYAREHGFIQFVMDWADELSSQTRRYIRKEWNILYKNKLLSLLGEILFEKGYASGSILFPEANMSVVSPLIREQLTIAKEINSPKLASQAYIVQAFAYYALGRYSFGRKYRRFYKKSLEITNKALSAEKSDIIMLICWRYIALNSTYLSSVSLFQQAEKEIRKIIERHKNDYNFSYITWALDSVARGQSYFGNSKAINTILESKSYEQKIKWRDPLRESATTRNELEVLKKLKITDRSYIQRRVERGLLLSSEHGFYRYKKYFENYSM
ncbi:hypothetical protein HYU45_00085 [Candidatus Daviesbacteria bacterium]|nr:hypothetical protein [Candidatus Levybacteria bacterium]MBI2195996.1 hypothetical protein [Candidatus Daviesbacteria bacterium]MBI2622485.1 hypothetical protein [Candidatus Levybacteria bacterium]